MPTAAEAALARGPLASALAAGVEVISENQTVIFTQYVRLVLPLDGYVFWVKADLLSAGARYNSILLNKTAFNQGAKVLVPAVTCEAQGSLHFSTDVRQEADETYAAHRVVFTSLEAVEDLNAVGPNTLFIAAFDGIKFAFSSRSMFYKQAELWHYVGMAVYPDMEPQLVDKLDGLDVNNVIVSNSLPAWLALNSYVPSFGIGNPGITLYPAFLLPENLTPPFGSIDIPPETTRGLAQAPTFDANLGRSQLCTDRVKITLWGSRSFSAFDFVDFVQQYVETSFPAPFGLMSQIPVPRDERRTQVELATIAQKKTIEYEISYLQSRMRTIARKLLLEVIPALFVNGEQVSPPV